MTAGEGLLEPRVRAVSRVLLGVGEGYITLVIRGSSSLTRGGAAPFKRVGVGLSYRLKAVFPWSFPRAHLFHFPDPRSHSPQPSNLGK